MVLNRSDLAVYEIRQAKLSYRLFPSLALITMCSIYIGQLVWFLPASLVMPMRDMLRGVAYGRESPHPALSL